MVGDVNGSGGESGAKLGLALGLAETEVLVAAVELLIRLDASVLLGEDLAAQAAEIVSGRQTDIGAARERLGVLRALRTALFEHGAALSEGAE